MSHDEGDPRVWAGADGVHLDLRGLKPPEPLVRTLRHLAQTPRDRAVVVHLERDPLMLYPELAQIGWQAERLPGDDGEVRLKLTALP